ncbi:hypothetical protein AB4072_16420 [Microvirga sp. 2MCAF38]|uniref:hypothetical protein n=1 Tax=Microvirga sp. 2MCAF38 TaxID=3232989 RepID=UPI003F986E5C
MTDDARQTNELPEKPGVATRPVLLVVIGFFAFVGVSLALLKAYYTWTIRTPVFTPPRLFPEPRLQADPRPDLEHLQAAQRRQLMEYAWVDRNRSLIRIPITRAMDLIAARGEQAFSPLDEPETSSPVRIPEKRP